MACSCCLRITFTEATLGPGGRTLDIRLVGKDLDQLKLTATEVQTWLGGFASVTDLNNHLRLTAANRGDSGDLDDLSLVGHNGFLVPLHVAVDVEETRGWARIHRVDGERAVTMQGDVKSDTVNAAELLALQYRGYLAPITVMSVIPSALIRVVFGHQAMGLSLTPLLTETRMQAQILIPLAASLAFGLTSATLIAIFLVPAIYCVLDDFDLLGEVAPVAEQPQQDVANREVLT